MDFLNPILLDKSKAFDPKVSNDFFELYRKVRLDVLRTTCKLRDIKGLIITEAYSGKGKFMTDIIKIAKTNKCRVYLIKLKCDIRELEKRIYSESRKPYRKVKSKKALYDWFERMGERADAVYPYKKTLILDNTKQSVVQSRKEILNFIKNN